MGINTLARQLIDLQTDGAFRGSRHHLPCGGIAHAAVCRSAVRSRKQFYAVQMSAPVGGQTHIAATGGITFKEYGDVVCKECPS